MKIGIVGNGVVGSATAHAFREHEVRITDRMRAKETHQLSDVLECDIVFICLPTPQKEGSLECDTSVIDSFFQFGLPDRFKQANFVLRSTVSVGYTRAAREWFGLPNLVHSPEFLTARTAKEDACNPTRMIIGGNQSYGSQTLLSQNPVALHNLYVQRWPQVPLYHMSSDESEFVKLMQNSFSAVKVAFFNEVRTFADVKSLDWNRCLEALLAGGWINPAHTQVPGPDGKRGFGGTCLPKDLASLSYQMDAMGLDADVCLAAYYRNQEIDRK